MRAPNAMPDETTIVSGVRVLLDVAVYLGHRRQDRPPRDDLEPLARVPEIRIRDRRARIVERAHREESEPLLFDQLLKERIGDDRGPVAAPLEREPEGNDRMDVAGAADGRQQQLETFRRIHRVGPSAGIIQLRVWDSSYRAGSASIP